MIKSDEILQKYWGHAAFRPLQEDIINSVLKGNDTLALLPTGGGKSVCYQVPGLAMDGMCIVISPLIALMHDQVQQLEKKGIKAVAITSAMNYREIETVFTNAIYKTYKFLYISPERIQTKLFLRKLASLPVNLIAIDESHCISQWGYDFRPSYLQIKKIRELKPDVPLLAVTATATQKTVEDIIAQLEFKKDYAVFKTSFARENLHYHIKKEENKFETLLNTCNKIKGTGIVYVRNRRKTKEIADFLIRQKITADFYHAGLEATERAKKQSDWINNRKRIIVSTNAFGMGIDKPDVRFVVHMDLPDSLEAWFQEAGRGGRDGKISYAITLYNDADILNLEEQLEQAFPTIEQIKQVYSAICNFYQIAVGAGEGMSMLFNLDEISAKYKLAPSVIYNSVRFLEKENYMSFTDGSFQQTKLHIPVNKSELYNFQVQNPAMDHFIKVLLRSYAGLFENYININEFKIARAARIDLKDVTKNLEKLHKLQLIDFIPQSGLPRILFTKGRVDSKFLFISKENYTTLKKQALARIESVIDFVRNTNTCRNRKILHYFNETIFEDCKTCDICLRKTRLSDESAFRKIKEQINMLLDHKTYPFAELVSLMYHYPKEDVVNCVNQMADDKEIKISTKQIVSRI
ncbi:MAG TPA: ATP-dependent DNA helicase RecQ [Bacteroidia bacterium]|jgi:ATP-dependent DNA helicase RecQ|nr:ATP-dependent DNA helicase RecQ [Bacteroidia bacterium]